MVRRRTPEELEYAERREARKAGRKQRRPAEAAAEDSPAPVPFDEAGIVAGLTRARCFVEADSERLACQLAPELLRRREPLAVGDRVVLDASRSLVTAVLPRRSELVRLRDDRQRRSTAGQERQVIAANVELAVIVAAKSHPPFHPRLIDRYLVMCRFGGVEPLICLNKADLLGPLPDLSLYDGLGVPWLPVSAATGEGMASLRAQLAGRTSVLVGHSGVGKSSLVNTLLGEPVAAVGDLGRRSRGRHTTTGSSLHRLPEGGWLLDTPGIRSLGLWAIDRSSLRHYFPEFAEPALACRYRDCSHTVEPACAVRAAAERGEIPPARYESYLRLWEEAGS